MRGAKSDFEIFADNEDPSKPVKRPERSRKEAQKSKSPPTANRTTSKGTARSKKTVTEPVRKPGLKVLANNNKENVNPLLKKPVNKKIDGNVAGQGTSKVTTALQTITWTVLNEKNRNAPDGKSLKEKPAPPRSTPKSKQTTKTSAIPFSPLADITEAFNSKCPTPLPLSVSFNAASTVIVERRLEEESATLETAQVPDTSVRTLRTELCDTSFEEDKTIEVGKIIMLHEDISPNTASKIEELNRNICPSEPSVSHSEDQFEVKHDTTEHAKDPVATNDASKTTLVGKVEVEESSSGSTTEPILSSPGHSYVDVNQPLVIPNANIGLCKVTHTQEYRSTDIEHHKPKNNLKTSVNKQKRKTPDDVDFDEECPNKRRRDENYIACTDLLEIKLGSDRSATKTMTTTIQVLPAKPLFIKRFIMEFDPVF